MELITVTFPFDYQISIDVSMDLISAVVLFLSVAIIPATALISITQVKHHPRYFYSILLIIEPAIASSLLLLNIFLVILALELVLLLTWVIIQL